MKLSLIIATYNQPQALKLVLKSLIKQDLAKLQQHEIEVLIADDGSNRPTLEVINQYKLMLPFNLIHVWHEDKGFRLASIRNLAVAQSSGEYLVFIDGDCLLPQDFLANQISLAEANYLVAGNRVLLSKAYTQFILNSQDLNLVEKRIWLHIFNKLTGRTNKFSAGLRLSPTAKWRKLRENNWKFPKGCNIGVWKTDYIQVNGFDESFSGWGHEDADFFIRLLHLGVKIKDGRFSVPVFHLWHGENDRSLERENWQRLMKRLSDKQFIQALVGINQYLGKN